MSFQSTVTQMSASDGAGPATGTSIPALIWVALSIVAGLPLAIAGVRLSQWRIPQALALALAGGVCCWAAIINSELAPGVSDLALTLVVSGVMAAFFCLGLFPFMQVSGTVVLGIVGGLSIGVRLVILKKDLLLPIAALDWLFVALTGTVCGLIVIWRPRLSIIIGSASAGSFLIALAVDLLVHKTSGVSNGLRHLFDHNGAHRDDLSKTPYRPAVLTQVIIAISLLLIPVISFAQSRFLPDPPPKQDPELQWNEHLESKNNNR